MNQQAPLTFDEMLDATKAVYDYLTSPEFPSNGKEAQKLARLQQITAQVNQSIVAHRAEVEELKKKVAPE